MRGQYKLRLTWNFRLQIMKYAFWCHRATPFQFQIQLVLVNVLAVLNKLNWKNQHDLVDISTIGSTFDLSFFILHRHFLCGYGCDYGRWPRTWVHYCQSWVDGALRWRANDDVEGTYHPMHHRWIFDWKDGLDECKMMGAMYVQAIEDSLNESVIDLFVLDTSKLVSQKYYPSDEEVV